MDTFPHNTKWASTNRKSYYDIGSLSTLSTVMVGEEGDWSFPVMHVVGLPSASQLIKHSLIPYLYYRIFRTENIVNSWFLLSSDQRGYISQDTNDLEILTKTPPGQKW